MTKDTEDLFMCLLGICISSLEKYLSKFFAHLKIEMTFHYHILRVLYICWMVSLSIYICVCVCVCVYTHTI